jgi:hypothetical protein
VCLDAVLQKTTHREVPVVLYRLTNYAILSLSRRVAGMYRAALRRNDLQATSGIVKHPVGQAAHLWMAAIASVLAQSVSKSDYLTQSLEECTTQVTAAGSAAGRVIAQEKQFASLTKGADEGVRSGG